jgi:uncharacterized membrane protein
MQIKIFYKNACILELYKITLQYKVLFEIMQSNKINISFSISRATLSLLLLTVLCCILLIIRAVETQHVQGIFLLWNLFLAWVPLFFALVARRLSSSALPFAKSTQTFIYVTLALWLLFFPNSPYIITDLMHLGEFEAHILWFDAVGFFVAALAGLATGLYSLYVAHQVLNRLTNSLIAWCIVSVSVILSGFGLYLGRFIRFNSWDLFTNPVHLFRKSIYELQNPLAIQTTLVFTLVVMVLYISMIILIPSRYASAKNAA